MTTVGESVAQAGEIHLSKTARPTHPTKLPALFLFLHLFDTVLSLLLTAFFLTIDRVFFFHDTG